MAKKEFKIGEVFQCGYIKINICPKYIQFYLDVSNK